MLVCMRSVRLVPTVCTECSDQNKYCLATKGADGVTFRCATMTQHKQVRYRNGNLHEIIQVHTRACGCNQYVGGSLHKSRTIATFLFQSAHSCLWEPHKRPVNCMYVTCVGYDSHSQAGDTLSSSCEAAHKHMVMSRYLV